MSRVGLFIYFLFTLTLFLKYPKKNLSQDSETATWETSELTKALRSLALCDIISTELLTAWLCYDISSTRHDTALFSPTVIRSQYNLRDSQSFMNPGHWRRRFSLQKGDPTHTPAHARRGWLSGLQTLDGKSTNSQAF